MEESECGGGDCGVGGGRGEGVVTVLLGVICRFSCLLMLGQRQYVDTLTG